MRKTFLLIIAIVIVMYASINSAPSSFPKEITVTVEKGTSLSALSTMLSKSGLIRSSLFFKGIVFLDGGQKSLVAGDYLFSTPLSAHAIATRIVHGKYGIAPVKVTVSEGLTSRQISDILASKLTGFDKEQFLLLSRGKEGFLFPDTYLFYPKTAPQEIIQAMTDNFDKKIEENSRAISAFDKPLLDVITMASIIEQEASSTQDRKMIAGILWNRLKIGMLLQVDVAFSYIFGTSTPKISLGDLKTDSLYNTYIHKGLPLGPIDNPGIDSILATVKPTQSPYLFYLSDKNGVMHYAKTNDEHIANKKKYLQ